MKVPLRSHHDDINNLIIAIYVFLRESNMSDILSDTFIFTIRNVTVGALRNVCYIDNVSKKQYFPDRMQNAIEKGFKMCEILS